MDKISLLITWDFAKAALSESKAPNFTINLLNINPAPDTTIAVTKEWKHYDKAEPKQNGKVTIREVCSFKGIKIKESTKGFEIKKDIKDPFEGMSPEEIEKLMEKIQ